MTGFSGRDCTSTRFGDIRFLIAIALASCLSACAAVRPPLQPVPAADLISGVLAMPSAHALQTLGSLRITSPEGSLNAAFVAFYRFPDSVKVQIQGGFGTTLAEIVLAGGRGIAYLPQQRQAFEIGEGSALVVGTAVIYPSLLLHLLKPVEAERLALDSDVSISGGKYVVSSARGSGNRTWRIAGRSRRLEAEQFESSDAGMSWDRSFGTVQGLRVPDSFSVRLGDTSMNATFSRIIVSCDWPNSPFVVRLPDGMVPMPLATE